MRGRAKTANLWLRGFVWLSSVLEFLVSVASHFRVGLGQGRSKTSILFLVPHLHFTVSRGVRQDHVWCVFAESAIIFPIDFVWKLEPAISLSLYPVWQILVLN